MTWLACAGRVSKFEGKASKSRKRTFRGTEVTRGKS